LNGACFEKIRITLPDDKRKLTPGEPGALAKRLATATYPAESALIGEYLTNGFYGVVSAYRWRRFLPAHILAVS
jgi:hypothetical protein